MNWKRVICSTVALLPLSASVARAESPQVLWSTPYTLDKAFLSVKFTADSTQLLAGGDDRSTYNDRALIRRFDATTGAQLASTGVNYRFTVNEIALSPDEQSIITANYLPCNPYFPEGCEGGFLRYDQSLQEAQVIVGPESNASNESVDYSPDGQLIALGGGWYTLGETDYHNLRLVRASDLTLVRTMEGHLRGPNNGGTLSVRFSPDGTLLGTSGQDSFVKIWRVSDGALLKAFNFDDTYEVDSAEFSPDGQFIAAARIGVEAQIKVWNVATGELVRTFDVSPEYTSTTFNKVAWTRDGRFVVAGVSFGVGYGPNKIKFWNFETGELAQDYTTQEDRFINDITFSPDGQKFAWAASSQVFVAAHPFPPAPRPTTVVSRKLHNGVPFDINLPLTGNAGTECRSGGANNDYQVVLTFNRAVAFNHANVTAGAGQVTSATGSGSSIIVTNLTGVMGNQTITFTLFGMSDGSSAGDIVVPMRVLVGDTNGNGVVNATDVSQVKSQVGKPLNASNARADVNANGAITASDVALVKSSVGRTLPPGHADTPKR